MKYLKMFYAVALTAVLMLAGCVSQADYDALRNDNEYLSDKVASLEAQVASLSSTPIQEGEMNLLSGKHHVEIVIKDKGTIAVELDADTAPITVTNFIDLCNEGFYDGLTFHRIIDGFMMQGGDPEGTGMGGSDRNIKGEFAANGIENDISHVRGAISMARSQAPDSASSQFFIVHEDSTFLDGNYAAFGMVTSGMEIVDDICKNTPVTDDNGSVNMEDRPIIETIKVID